MISPDAICIADREGTVIDVNKACSQLMGYEIAEMVGRNFKEFVHPEDLLKTQDIVQQTASGVISRFFENRNIHKSGAEIHFIWSGVWSEEDEVLFCIGRDVTEQKVAMRNLREKEELYSTFAEHGSDMLSLFDAELNYLYCDESIDRILGYKPDQLIGTSAWQFIHPEDIPMLKEALASGLASVDQIEIPEFRFKDAAGGWRWLEARGSNQMQNPAIKGLIVSTRDVTDKVYSRKQLQESELRFKALFEANPDLVALISKEGMVMDVNANVTSFLRKEKHEIVNHPLSDFLPLENLALSNNTRQKAIDGKQVSYEIEIPLAGSDPRNFEIKKFPVTINHELIGVYTIARDITAAKKQQKIIKRQAKKLNTIFESITDAFFTLDKNWNFTYINSEFDKLLKTNRKEFIGKNIWTVFPEEVDGEFYRQYYRAVETNRAAHFEAYYEKLDIWLQVKAFPSKEGLSVYFDDITEKVKIKQELEKLALVASKTINGVVILDAEGKTEWVNDGFKRVTGYILSEVVGKFPGAVLAGEETDEVTLSRIKEKIKKDKPFSEEILIYRKSGEKAWLSLDITPILDNAGKVVNIVVLETDITSRKEAEMRQLQLTEDLYKRNSDLEQFTYIVSHNLRSPISAAMGLADLLSTHDRSSADFDTSLGYLQKSIYKIDSVLKTLQKILSARDKKTNTEEKVEIELLCQQVIDDQWDLLKSSGSEIFMDIEEGIAAQGNKAFLYSIFHNLLSNAVKYRSPDRPLQVNIACFTNEDEGVTILFSDNGSGFDMQVAGEDLFKLYKRFHNDIEGSGIGLYLVKKHVESMDGQIVVESKVNVGTKFLIYLNKPQK